MLYFCLPTYEFFKWANKLKLHQLKSLTAFLLSILLISCSEKEGKEEQTEAKASATLVEVFVVQEEALNESIHTSGNILANESVSLVSEATGIVKKIHFEEGEKVKKGQLLLELDNSDLIAELREINTKIKLAEDKKSRAVGLFEAKGISRESLDEISTNLESLKAQRSRVQANINKSRIVAPFSGTIGLRNISEGGYVSANSNVANLVDITPLKIEFPLAEKYQNAVKIGDKVSFSTSSLANKLDAEVYAIEPLVDKASRTITVRAMYPNKDEKLFPGGYADVTFKLQTFEEAIVIPNQAIIPVVDGKKVLLVEDGKVQSRKVETGIRMADFIQVNKGLSAGDSVITSGILQVRDGDKVDPKADVLHQSQSMDDKDSIKPLDQ